MLVKPSYKLYTAIATTVSAVLASVSSLVVFFLCLITSLVDLRPALILRPFLFHVLSDSRKNLALFDTVRPVHAA
jgi:hypothetical protein